MRIRAVLLVGVVLASAGVAASCSSNSEDSSATTTGSTAADSKTSPTASLGDPASTAGTGSEAKLCEVWDSIESGSVGTDMDQPTSKEGWDSKISWTKQLADAAPADQQEAAQAYLGVVERRAELLAQYDYVTVQELPGDVRDKFISDNKADQAQANDFISYTKDTCS
ncbi:MAG: hypothetical protein WCJ04_08240 [Actinomycetes bacterium]